MIRQENARVIIIETKDDLTQLSLDDHLTADLILTRDAKILKSRWTRLFDNELARYRRIVRLAMLEDDEISQTLGQALKFPWYKDDQENFPGATEEDGVCIGDHVATTLAHAAAQRIQQLEADNEAIKKVWTDYKEDLDWAREDNAKLQANLELTTERASRLELEIKQLDAKLHPVQRH